MQFSGLLLLITLLSLQTVFVLSLTFDLPSLPAGGVANHRCLSTYISKDMLVVGKFSVLPADGNTLQQIQLEVTDMEGSRLFGKQDARGTDQKFAFTSHAYSDHIICFTNILQPGTAPAPHLFKTIQFDLEIGPEAQAKQTDDTHTLKPIEQELKVLEQVMEGIVHEIEYLKQREVAMRDTNESTNDRVKWLSTLSTFTLIGSGVYQVWYLKRFFKSKKLL